jgi:prefoldin alpha subunit
MLVPLTKSLYAPGKLGATDRVLVDVGTGYFIEYSPSGGVDYCKRKLLMLRENLDKLGEVRGWTGGAAALGGDTDSLVPCLSSIRSWL